ncbi:Cardiolipin synthetase [hydrothermal vent metagenome]|uniref:Cardiolipin synthetase n=1 Tax=hydrothermal vent metagenome TaxID=652676 RepID=A0A1W1EDW7_9ZZZZ
MDSFSIWAIVIAVLYVLGILSAINAVMETRTSQGAIAWVLFLILFPYLSLPIYWIFGRNKFKGYMEVKNSSDLMVQKKIREIASKIKPYRREEWEHSGIGKATEQLSLFPYLNGNSVELLVDGEDTFESIIEGLDAAKTYICFQFYILKDDALGLKMQEHLIAKAKEGVSVYVLFDEMGSFSLSASYKNRFKEAGVKVYAFNTRKGKGNYFQINFRNHRKVVVVDGKTAWIGGHNIGDEYLGKDPKVGNWRDTHVKIEGPSALAAQLSFVEDWYWATGSELRGISWDPETRENENKEVMVVPSGPADALETASLMFHHAINEAKERIWIATPYFVPDDAILAALQLAALRGVDVRILTPDKSDNMLVNLASYSYVEDVGKIGVRFFRYSNGFLHQKVLLVDDYISMVGTANFDNRSFRLNFEITAVIEDRSFATEVEEMLKNDFAHASEMTKEDIEKRSFGFKLAIRLARLTAPVQ